MSHPSPPDVLVLHAVRVLGFAEDTALARRFGLDPGETTELLLDAEARGWVRHGEFAGHRGWSLTEAGKERNERLLAAELIEAGAVEQVRDVYRAFLPWNERLQRACTNWQLKPMPGGRFEPNDHADPAWDDSVLDDLGEIEGVLVDLDHRLAGVLARFAGYHRRFGEALQRARDGDRAWIDRSDIDSCHRVWFELHEDLVATLGIDRAAESS